MVNLDLFAWWTISISGGIVFLTLVSIYLYIASRTEHKTQMKKPGRIAKNFIFVWVLLGLLVFYIVTIQLGSIVLFAIGNVIVEALLIIYLRKNKTEKTE